MTDDLSQRPNVVPSVLLVVDDDPSALEIADQTLKPTGYQVLRASNGPDAIALLASGTPLDLLIADLSMPGVGGAEMVRRIRMTRPDLKVLYVTASSPVVS
jgi:CheY-like chemotaxis protein